MDESNNNKISRRDALKILGAVIGATALTNLPTKWTTPALAASQLPAHARQSVSVPCVEVNVGVWDGTLSDDGGAKGFVPGEVVTLSYEAITGVGTLNGLRLLVFHLTADGTGIIHIPDITAAGFVPGDELLVLISPSSPTFPPCNHLTMH